MRARREMYKAVCANCGQEIEVPFKPAPYQLIHCRDCWLRARKAKAWELEDQLKELKEQLSRGAITQEEYKQKKKLLEKSKT